MTRITEVYFIAPVVAPEHANRNSTTSVFRFDAKAKDPYRMTLDEGLRAIVIERRGRLAVYPLEGVLMFRPERIVFEEMPEVAELYPEPTAEPEPEAAPTPTNAKRKAS